MIRRRSKRSERKAGGEPQADKRGSVGGGNNKVPGPSPNSFTNIMLADLVIRSSAYLMRDLLEKRLLRERYGKQTASEIVRKKPFSQRAMSLGLATLATRSVPGALIVGGGALAKTLYDRSQNRRKQRRKGDRKLAKTAQSDD